MVNNKDEWPIVKEIIMHCKDCRWWETQGMTSDNKHVGSCSNDKALKEMCGSRGTYADFGCIHLEEKEKLQAVYNLELRIDKGRMNNEPDFFNMLNVFISSYGYHFKITHSCIEDLLKEDT
jgi:hypothetical protein